jgi:integrase
MATLRKRSDSPYWWVYWNVSGEPFAKSTGIRHDNCRSRKPSRSSDAHKFLVAFENQIVFSRLGVGTVQDIAVTEAVVQFMENVHAQVKAGAVMPSTYDQQYMRWKRFAPQLKTAGITTIQSLTVSRATDYRNSRDIHATSWNRECGYMVTFWEHFIKRGANVKNVWKDLMLSNARTKHQKRALTSDEVELMFQRGSELGEDWQYLTYMMYFTGCRIGAASQLRRESVLFDERTIWLANKNSADHNAYMPTPLLEFLRDMNPAGETWLAKTDPCYWSGRWKRDAAKLGIDVTAHYIRNTFITRLGEKLDQRVTMNIVGHKNPEVHELYNRNTAHRHAADIERSLHVRFLQNESGTLTVLKSTG